MSLAEYVLALPVYCAAKHREDCTECSGLLQVANTVLENGFMKLSDAHHCAFPYVSYHSHNAKRRFLRMPYAALQVGLPKSGYAEVFLFKHFAGVNYNQFLQLLNFVYSEKHTKWLCPKKSLEIFSNSHVVIRRGNASAILHGRHQACQLQLGENILVLTTYQHVQIMSNTAYRKLKPFVKVLRGFVTFKSSLFWISWELLWKIGPVMGSVMTPGLQ